MFFGQQFLIRRITKKDDRILQLFRQFGSALLITFDEFNAVIFFQTTRQPCTDITATNQHDPLIRFFQSL
ncbi:Uncharacterised protein [Shigella sonnei]|nr:Uncharacterised protein [Shigella sonnei]SIZ04559.1 Uncharacterised protein [Shigella sonnei]